MIAWACDNDRDDNLDSSFLWEPNSGRDWVGAACANEVLWNLDTLTQVYVNCGDPILNYYLRGALERWHLLYQDAVYDSLADYRGEDLAEGFGLFDGTMVGPGSPHQLRLRRQFDAALSGGAVDLAGHLRPEGGLRLLQRGRSLARRAITAVRRG